MDQRFLSYSVVPPLVQFFSKEDISLRRGLHKDTLHVTRQRVLSPASEPSESKLAVPVARNDEKTGQSATSALDNCSASQRLTTEFWWFITCCTLTVSITLRDFKLMVPCIIIYIK